MHIKRFLVCAERELSLEDTELVVEIREKKKKRKVCFLYPIKFDSGIHVTYCKPAEGAFLCLLTCLYQKHDIENERSLT